MENDKNYFVAGLFVIAIILAGVGFTLWLTSAGKGGYDHFRIHFAESVSGLHRESVVKFRGVEVGNVEEISIHPENSKLIRVDIRVLKTAPVKTDTTATLKLYGITGDVYVELSGGKEDAPELEAKDGELPEIKAEPSSINAILNGVPRLLEKTNHIADQIAKIFNDENIRSFNGVVRTLYKHYGDKEED